MQAGVYRQHSISCDLFWVKMLFIYSHLNFLLKDSKIILETTHAERKSFGLIGLRGNNMAISVRRKELREEEEKKESFSNAGNENKKYSSFRLLYYNKVW